MRNTSNLILHPTVVIVAICLIAITGYTIETINLAYRGDKILNNPMCHDKPYLQECML